MKKPPTTDPAFTLVELLVVIAIIAIIVSLVLPVLVGVKASAKQAQCLSNIRQLGLASQLYWDANDQRMFPYLSSREGDGLTYWFGWLQSGSEGHRQFDPAQGVIWPYLQSRGIKQCPAFDYRHPKYKPKATGAAYGYGYNLHLSASEARMPTENDTMRLVSQIQRPTDIALFADAAQINDFQAPASFDNPLVEEFYYVSNGGSAYANGHFRHRQKAAVAYIDGHAGSVDPAPKSRDLRLPAMNLARLPKHNLIP
ncbi:MAG: hypothetical protein M2R45_03095 [Verrucomicrobia subdivision 3 bacterium]|nr:hypothetical protein [Limisphaerales bacterium]MCS1413163.1 hypothetical protein [Limisphaerales bacterium]